MERPIMRAWLRAVAGCLAGLVCGIAFGLLSDLAFDGVGTPMRGDYRPGLLSGEAQTTLGVSVAAVAVAAGIRGASRRFAGPFLFCAGMAACMSTSYGHGSDGVPLPTLIRLAGGPVLALLSLVFPVHTSVRATVALASPLLMGFPLSVASTYLPHGFAAWSGLTFAAILSVYPLAWMAREGPRAGKLAACGVLGILAVTAVAVIFPDVLDDGDAPSLLTVLAGILLLVLSVFLTRRILRPASPPALA